MEAKKTNPVLPFFLAGTFGAAVATGLAVTLIFFFSNLQGWFFTRVW